MGKIWNDTNGCENEECEDMCWGRKRGKPTQGSRWNGMEKGKKKRNVGSKRTNREFGKGFY